MYRHTCLPLQAVRGRSSPVVLAPRALACAAALFLAGCGGGTGSGSATVETSEARGVSTAAAGTWKNSEATTATRGQAFRLLTQATFGPTEWDLSRAQSMGLTAWVDDQLAKPQKLAHYAYYQDQLRAEQARDPAAGGRTDFVYESFYQQALTAPDQLRQRVAYALSQIFVVSLADFTGSRSAMVASFHDMLTKRAFGNYRTLLEDVALHLAMGVYLSHRGNRKEDPASGRLPDENFAREVMQLFSIGLVQLNKNGTPVLDARGEPIESYTPDDVAGLAKVFTGWSWAGPDTSDDRFYGLVNDVSAMHAPMQPYDKFHSTSEKRFLGKVIPPQATADARASLRVALDTLFNHPNTAPFVSKQLIQRLVTSNPSPAYVRRVAEVFENNGNGRRGDLSAVVRAILLDAEARDTPWVGNSEVGKLREPVLRLTAYLRAFKVKSNSGRFQIWRTDDPTKQLAQSPLRSPTVFNFYRPGFAPAGSGIAASGMAAPEFQLTNESSVVGAVNYFASTIPYGMGARPAGPSSPADVYVNYDAELALAEDAEALVAQVVSKLTGEFPTEALRAQVVAAVNSINIPKLNRDGSNQVWIDLAKRNRVYTAVLLVLSAHETQIQR